MLILRLLIAASLLISVDVAQAGDWMRFRGADGAGIAVDSTIPLDFTLERNLEWKVALPAGTSSPIVVGDRLFVTWHKDDRRVIQCLNADTGKELWQKPVTKNHDEPATAPAGPSTPTPVSDGKRVFVYYPDTGVFAWTLDGEQIWERAAKVSRTMHGLSSSLVYADGMVFQVVDQLNDSFITAFDAKSGETVWKVERVSGVTGAYSTPLVYRPASGATQIITTGPLEVVGYDAATGKRLWWLLGKCNAPVSSPILKGDTLFFCEPVAEPIPFSMVAGMDANKDGKLQLEEGKASVAVSRLIERIDGAWGDGDNAVDSSEWNKAFRSFEGKGGLVSIKVGGKGDMTEDSFHWSFRKGMPQIPGVMASDNVILAVNDGGIVTSVDPKTGEQLHKGRLKKGTSKYYSSPVATRDHVVFADIKGVINVVTNAPQWETVHTLELGEPVFATPAISNNRLYIRTTSSLYCFEAIDK